jgi:hypothetical protein
MGICGLLEGEPTTRFELVTYRLRILKHILTINDLQECCVHVAFYSKLLVSGFQVTASMFRPAGVDGLFAALVVFGVAAVALAVERSLISACTEVVNPEGLRECVTVFIVQLLFIASGNPESVIRPSAMMSGLPDMERVMDSLPRSLLFKNDFAAFLALVSSG